MYFCSVFICLWDGVFWLGVSLLVLWFLFFFFLISGADVCLLCETQIVGCDRVVEVYGFQRLQVVKAPSVFSWVYHSDALLTSSLKF